MLLKFSSDFLMNTFTLVDNKFIIEFMPDANLEQIKVYLYGLYQAVNHADEGSLSDMATVLDISEDKIVEIYAYWQDCGLVSILTTRPLEVKYLSMKNGNQPPRKFKAEKYFDFNQALQSLYPERQLLPNELNEYYLFFEQYKIDQDAVLMIAKFCIDQKGANVRYPYVLAVARDWAKNGVKTIEDVEDKLNDYEAQTDSMRLVLKSLGRKGGADLDEKQMLVKWTKSWGFELVAVLSAIKINKIKTFKKLDSTLDDYFRKNIFTEVEMKDYENHMSKMREIAIKINKTIGVYYESMEHIIETYTIPWSEKGFEEESLLLVANMCFKANIKTLDGVDKRLQNFFANGIISKKSIENYIQQQLAHDETIKKIIEKTGRTRNVTNNDRESFKLWSATWGFSLELILYAAECSSQRAYPIPYMTQLLESWKNQGITTLQQAKLQTTPSQNTKYQPKQNPAVLRQREYTQEDLASIFEDYDAFDK